MKIKQILFLFAAGAILLPACNESTTMSNRFSVSLHANYIRPDQTDFQFQDAAGGTTQFTVNSQDTPWQISSVPEWITISPLSGRATASVSVTVPNYTWAVPRVGIFTLASASEDWNFNKQMSVTQAGAVPYATIAKLDFSFDGKAHEETVKAASNFDWNLSYKGNTWISVTNRGEEMIVAVPANETGADRTGEVDVIFNNQVMATVKVTQLAADVKIKTDPLNFEIGAGTYKLNVESEAPWKASSYYDWIEVSPASGAAGKTEVTVSVPPNPNDGARDGYVYFNFQTSGYQIAEIPVHQDGVLMELPLTDEERQNLTSLGGDFTWTLRSNTDWTITQCPDFLTITPMSGSGTTNLSVKLAENATFDQKSGELTFVRPSTGYTINYWMRQRERYRELNATWLECNDLAQDLYVDVKTEGGWMLTPQENATFFTTTPLQARGNGRITFSVQENTDYGNRQGRVDFSLTGMEGYDGGIATTDNIYINQLGWQDKYHEIAQEVQLPCGGGTMPVDIATNDGWTAAFISSASWIKLDGTASGKGAGSFQVSFDENKTPDARSVKVRVTFEHLDPVEFTLTQLGRAIRLSSDALYFFAKGGSVTVAVDADGTYSVERASGDWFTVTPGENNTFTVTASAYSGDAERTGSIVLKLTDLQTGSYSLTLPVTQTTASGFTRGGWSEDRDLNIGTAPGFTIKVSGYAADQNWSGGRRAEIGGEGYGDDENWN